MGADANGPAKNSSLGSFPSHRCVICITLGCDRQLPECLLRHRSEPSDFREREYDFWPRWLRPDRDLQR